MRFIELFKEDFTPDYLKIFSLPSFCDMESCKQSAKWHKEGNVQNHTVLVTENMMKLCNNVGVERGSEKWITLISAAICHDIGKPTSTFFDKETNDYKCVCHGKEGEKITRRMFYEEDIILREKVCYMVRHHMILHHIFDKCCYEYKIKEMSWGLVPFYDMIMLNIADCLGSNNDVQTPKDIEEHFTKLCQIADAHLGCVNTPYEFKDTYHRLCKFFTDKDEDTEKTPENYKDFTIYVMVGLPGAGKDTWIKNNLPDKKVICRDDIRTRIGIKGEKPQGDRKQEEQVTEIAKFALEEACKNRKDVVINNTNLKKEYRKEYIRAAVKYGAKLVYVYVEAPAFEDNLKRREGTIPQDVIENMLDNFEFPYPIEYDEIIYAVQR